MERYKNIYICKSESLFHYYISPFHCRWVRTWGILHMYACLSLDSLNKMIFLWRHTFDKAADHVYTLLLKKDCYPRSVHASTPAFPRLFLLPHLWRNMYTYELKIYCWFLPGINSLCFKLWFLYGGGVGFVRFNKYDYFVWFLPPPGDYSYCIYLGWSKGGYYPLCTPVNTRRHCNCCCYCNYHF